MAIERQHKFDDIPGLDKELKSIIDQVQATAVGKTVTQLPPVGQQKDLALFYVKQSDGSYFVYRKIGGEYKQLLVNGNQQVYL